MYNEKYLHTDYILTQALEALEALEVFELFVYISLPLLIHSMHSRFSMCLCILIHAMHASYSCTLICPCWGTRGILCTLGVCLNRSFGRRSIAAPIDSVQSMYSFSTPVYYLYTRAVLCTRSQLCSHLKICFTHISLSSSFLLQLDLYVYTRLPRAAAPPIDVNIYANTLHRSTGVRVGLGNAIFA